MRSAVLMCLGVVFVALVVFPVSPYPAEATQNADPCAYKETADYMLEVVIYKKGPGFESYVIFGNRERRMISTFGTLRAEVNGKFVLRVDIDCKDFQFFERGIQRETILAYQFKWISLASIEDVINWGTGADADNFCVSLSATYTAGKALCKEFYGRF